VGAGANQSKVHSTYRGLAPRKCPKKEMRSFLPQRLVFSFYPARGLFVTKKLPTATLVDVVEVFVVYKIFGGSTYRGVHIEAISSAASHTRVEKDIDHGCRRQRNNIQR